MTWARLCIKSCVNFFWWNPQKYWEMKWIWILWSFFLFIFLMKTSACVKCRNDSIVKWWKFILLNQWDKNEISRIKSVFLGTWQNHKGMQFFCCHSIHNYNRKSARCRHRFCFGWRMQSSGIVHHHMYFLGRVSQWTPFVQIDLDRTNAVTYKMKISNKFHKIIPNCFLKLTLKNREILPWWRASMIYDSRLPPTSLSGRLFVFQSLIGGK